MPAKSGPTPCPTAARTSPWTFRVFHPTPAFPNHNRPLDPASALCRRISALSAFKLIAMSGSKTAIPIRSPSPTPCPPSTSESSTTTAHGGAHNDTATGSKWWTEEDLKRQEAGSSESSTACSQGMSEILTGGLDRRLLNKTRCIPRLRSFAVTGVTRHRIHRSPPAVVRSGSAPRHRLARSSFALANGDSLSAVSLSHGRPKRLD